MSSVTWCVVLLYYVVWSIEYYTYLHTTEYHVYDVQDIEFYNSLKYILDNDPEPLCLHFTATRDHYGEVVK